MEWKSAQPEKEQRFVVPQRWLHIHYYEALNILFRFENSLRVFVFSVMKNEHLNKWCSVTFDSGGQQKSISNLASKRISQADNFGYLGYDVKCPIMFLTSGELVELIISEAYWPLFKPHFRGNKDIIKNKLLEVGDIRNSLAHFRPIKEDDVELIKQNSRHSLLGVEEYLIGLFSQTDRVPTNTQDKWYKDLSTIGSEVITTNPLFSADEEWVNIQLHFKSTVIDKNTYGGHYHTYKVTRLVTPNVISNHEDLAKYVTHASERALYPSIDKDFDIQLTKLTNLVFRTSVLAENVDAITAELKKIVATVSDEVGLLVNDNLARGTLVDGASSTAYWMQKEGEAGAWQYGYGDTVCPYNSSHPFEYWGDLVIFSNDVIASASRYPWMPSDISDQEFPF